MEKFNLYDVYEQRKRSGITPAQAVTILKKNGVEVTEQQAEEILDTLFFLINLTVDQIIEEEDHKARRGEIPE